MNIFRWYIDLVGAGSSRRTIGAVGQVARLVSVMLKKTPPRTTCVADNARGRVDHEAASGHSEHTQMKALFYQLGFVLYKLLVRPFKRTPTRWSAIIFNKAGQFVVEHNIQGRCLPSGDVTPGYPIPHLCRRGLGLDQSHFTSTAPLRLIGIAGRGGEEMTLYYSGEITSDFALINRFGSNVSFAQRSELSSFIPAEIEIISNSAFGFFPDV